MARGTGSAQSRYRCLVLCWLLVVAGEFVTSSTLAQTADADRLRQTIRESIEKPGRWQVFHLLVECSDRLGFRSLQVLDRGVAIWNGTHQFQLTPEQISGLLRRIESHGFIDFEERYGGGPAAEPGSVDPGSPPTSAMVVLCQVDLLIDGLHRRSQQLARGEPFESLYGLAGDLLDDCQEQGRSGVTAIDLDDGLRKLENRELAPETLTLQLQRRGSDPAHPDTAPAGFILALAGSRLEARTRSNSGEYSDPVHLVLGASAFDELLHLLAAADPGSLPLNLWAPAYTDLTIRILDHSQSIQARPFGRLTPDTYGERQQAFDHLVEKLSNWFSEMQQRSGLLN